MVQKIAPFLVETSCKEDENTVIKTYSEENK